MPASENASAELNSILNSIRPGKDYASAENFFDQGLLDSLDLTALVAELEGRFSVFVDVDEMVPENFRSFDAITGFLARKGVSL